MGTNPLGALLLSQHPFNTATGSDPGSTPTHLREAVASVPLISSGVMCTPLHLHVRVSHKLVVGAMSCACERLRLESSHLPCVPLIGCTVHWRVYACKRPRLPNQIKCCVCLYPALERPSVSCHPSISIAGNRRGRATRRWCGQTTINWHNWR